jgi:hypothetical protein
VTWQNEKANVGEGGGVPAIHDKNATTSDKRTMATESVQAVPCASPPATAPLAHKRHFTM